MGEKCQDLYKNLIQNHMQRTKPLLSKHAFTKWGDHVYAGSEFLVSVKMVCETGVYMTWNL